MQKIQKRYRNLLISLAITGGLVALSFLLFYPDRSGLGNGFSISILYMIVRYAALYAGIIVLLGRLVRLLKNTGSILYILPGTINFLVGALCMILYFLGEADAPWLYKCLLNLLTGTLIIADAFILNKKDNAGRHVK